MAMGQFASEDQASASRTTPGHGTAVTLGNIEPRACQTLRIGVEAGSGHDASCPKCPATAHPYDWPDATVRLHVLTAAGLFRKARTSVGLRPEL